MTGFTSGSSGNGISYIVSSSRVKSLPFIVKDSAGPVLVNNAVLLERDGEGDDTITVTFSEAVSFDHLTGNVLLLRKKGTDYQVKVNAIRGIVQGTFTTTLNVQCAQKIEEGDSLLIDPSGVLDDLNGIKAHLKNKPVVITVKSAPPQLMSACYRDLNADGVIDRIDFTLNKEIAAKECEYGVKWGSNKDESKIKGENAVVSSTDPKTIQVAINGKEITGVDIATSGLMSVSVKHQKFGTTNIVSASDSAGPVILKGLFKIGAESTDDTLEVDFSESVESVPNDAFLLFSNKEHVQYSFACVEKKSNAGFTSKMFLVSEVRGVTEPGRNDSIWIRSDAGVKDMGGNVQSNPSNKRALLNIGQIRFKYKIISGPNPFLPRISIVADNSDIPEKSRGKRGFLVKINLSGDKVGKVTAVIKGSFKIIDGLGNMIYTGPLLKGINDELNNYYFLWEGVNSKGRLVGTGTYLAYLDADIVDESNPDFVPQQIKEMIKVGVKRESE
jgi:hypothetical protein